MFEPELRLVEVTSECLTLRQSISFRLICLPVVAVSCAGMIVTGALSFLGIAIAAIAGAGMLYYERWIFDSAKKTVEHHHGALILYRRTTTRFEEIECFDLRVLRRGSRPWVRFGAALNGGRSITLCLQRSLNDDQWHRAAERIADHCHRPLSIEA